MSLRPAQPCLESIDGFLALAFSELCSFFGAAFVAGDRLVTRPSCALSERTKRAGGGDGERGKRRRVAKGHPLPRCEGKSLSGSVALPLPSQHKPGADQPISSSSPVLSRGKGRERERERERENEARQSKKTIYQRTLEALGGDHEPRRAPEGHLGLAFRRSGSSSSSARGGGCFVVGHGERGEEDGETRERGNRVDALGREKLPLRFLGSAGKKSETMLIPRSNRRRSRFSLLSLLFSLLPSTTMINYKKLDAWRAHPMLTNTMRASAPGLAGGAALFLLYVAFDKATGGGKKAAH